MNCQGQCWQRAPHAPALGSPLGSASGWAQWHPSSAPPEHPPPLGHQPSQAPLHDPTPSYAHDQSAPGLLWSASYCMIDRWQLNVTMAHDKLTPFWLGLCKHCNKHTTSSTQLIVHCVVPALMAVGTVITELLHSGQGRIVKVVTVVYIRADLALCLLQPCYRGGCACLQDQ